MDFVYLECDGTDYTQKLREYGTHSLLFLNIEVITLPGKKFPHPPLYSVKLPLFATV